MDKAVGVEVPYDKLSREALHRLVEEFVTRDGTDYGARERALEDKIADVMDQLRRREAKIVFDADSGTANIVPVRR